jgi:hypothetical protein
MRMGCRDCRAGLDHCHGTLIHHSVGPLLGRSECTEPGCDSPESMPHTFAVDCEAVGCGCGVESVALAV